MVGCVAPCHQRPTLPALSHACTPQGEDWEHEEAAADDDLDMGESEEEDAGSPVRK